MKEYLWQPYGQGGYLLDKMPHGDGGEIRRYVEYPLKDDDVWRFNEVTEEKDGYKDTDGWNLSETEENEIKSYIRDVLKPNDLYEVNKDLNEKYYWDRMYDGNYFLEYVENTETRIVRHEVNYPIKGDKNGWYFFTSKTIDGEDMDFESWDLPIKEQEEIKNYIRNVLKPNDLYEESEEKEMEEMTVLSFGVPNELAEEVMNIVSRFEGVPVDTNFKGDQNPLDVAEIERLTTENENLRNELNKGHEVVNNLSDKYNDAKSIIHALLHEISDIDNFDNIFEAVFSKEKAKEYEVDNYIKEKYKVTKVKATKTITTNIYVLEKDNDNSYPEGVLENADEDLIDEYFGNYYDDKNEYEFEEERVSAEGLTEDQVRSRYSQEQLFTANDCNDIWN